jgi:hypothetical protein
MRLLDSVGETLTYRLAKKDECRRRCVDRRSKNLLLGIHGLEVFVATDEVF